MSTTAMAFCSKAHHRIRFFFFSVLSCALIAAPTSPAAGQDQQNATHNNKLYSQESYAQAFDRIANSQRAQNAELIAATGELNGQGAIVIRASQKIAAVADADLITLVYYRLHQEIIAEQPNFEVIRALIKCIGRTADKSFLPALEEIRELIKDRRLNISHINGHRSLYNEFDKAKERVSQRRQIQTYVNPDLINGIADEMLFVDYLKKSGERTQKNRGRSTHEKIPESYEKFLLAVMTGILTDDVRRAQAEGRAQDVEYSGRDTEVDQAMDVLVRPKSKTPVFVGASGVGKTTLGRILAHKILTHSYPQTELFKNELQGAEIIVTTPARISQMALSNEPTAQAAAVELFFEAVRAVEQNYFDTMKERKPIIVFIDGLHTMDPPQLLALRQILDNESAPVRVMGTSHNEALELKLKQAPEVQKLFERIAVREFSKEKTLEILKANWLPKFQQRYNITFDDEALSAALKVAGYLRPGLSRPEAPILALQSLAVKVHRENNGQAVTVTDDDVYAYARSVTGIPSNPHNAQEFNQYLEGLKTAINARVLNQPRMTDVLVKQWSQVLTGSPQLPKTVLFLGPTGVGKTLMAQTFAEKAFGDAGRMIEIDGTQMADGKFALGSIFGVPTGVHGSDLTSGVLMEWLDDPARGKMGGVIVINEADKMHPDAWKRLMEFMSQGVVTGGDGKARYANRHMIILTSNKGTREILPDTVKEWTQAEVDRRILQLSESDLKNYFLRADPSKDEIVLPREVLARINAAVFANPVTIETAPGIGRAEVSKYVEHMEELFHLQVQVSDELVKHLAVTGLDPLEGARPIHNQVETYLNQALTEARKKWNLPRDAQVKLDLEDAGPGAPLKIKVAYQAESILVAAPKKVHVNPLQDQDLRNMLAELPNVMHGHMVEQPEAVDLIVTAVKAKVGDANRKRPIAITLVGTTGVGKTEMGRALAKGMYTSGERMRVIALGEIHNTRELENVFGAVASSGVKVPAQFEQALMDNPQGGVIMFDEFSNMGGEDLVMKEALIKKFYTILEEGFWISPRDGRVYDLRKYVFMFTGNDLEKALQGVTSDDQRMAVWRTINSREKIQAALRENGVPEAFLGRQDAVVILRPLTGGAKSRVSGKLLEELKERFEKQHQGVTLSWEPNFLDQLARAFFSHDRGARSVRAVIENQVTALVTDALVQYGYDAERLQGVRLQLTLDDNLPEKVYADGDVVPRKVSLFAEVIKNDQRLLKLEMNASEAATKVAVVTKREAEMRAYHEAGHVIADQVELTQQRLEFVTIRSSLVNGQTVLGYSRYGAVPGTTNNMTRKRLIALLAHYWGGRLAQENAGHDPDSGWEADLYEMRRLTTDYLKRFGLHDGLVGVPVNEKGEPQLSSEQRADFEKEMKALFDESKAQGKKLISDNWAKVQLIANTLLEKGELTGNDVQRLIGGPVVDAAASSSTGAGTTCVNLLSR